LETKPGDAVSIIECDMDVDFAPPVGYQEPNWKKEAAKNAASGKASMQGKNVLPPIHPGYRLDGKPAKNIDIPMTSKAAAADAVASSFKSGSYSSPMGGASSFKEPPVTRRGIPNYEYKVGQLNFHRDFDDDEEMVVNFFRIVTLITMVFTILFFLRPSPCPRSPKARS
jgi:ubiquitin fusion degradation protein 1